MDKRIVEINGVKLEIDTREAKTVESYKVGDPVKVLVKSYSEYKSFPGIIVGFDEFNILPTIIVAYVDSSYSSTDIRFAYINGNNKETEICYMYRDELNIDKNSLVEKFNRDIDKKKQEIEDVEIKRDYFLKNFSKYFVEINKEGK